MSDDLTDIVALFPDHLAMGSSPRSDDVATLAEHRLVPAIQLRRGCDSETARALLLRAAQSVGGDRRQVGHHGGLAAGRSTSYVSDLYWVPWDAAQ